MKILIAGLLCFNCFVTQAKEQSLSDQSNNEAVLLVNESTSIKVIIEENQTIEEFRHKGQLYLVKVKPKNAKPYYLDPLETNRRMGSGHDLIESGVTPVYWVLKEF